MSLPLPSPPFDQGDDFALLEMNLGDKCLVHQSRVWINDKPKFGNWRVLHLSYFKEVNLGARKVKGFSEFGYQAVFAHAGMHNRQEWNERRVEAGDHRLK